MVGVETSGPSGQDPDKLCRKLGWTQVQTRKVEFIFNKRETNANQSQRLLSEEKWCIKMNIIKLQQSLSLANGGKTRTKRMKHQSAWRKRRLQATDLQIVLKWHLNSQTSNNVTAAEGRVQPSDQGWRWDSKAQVKLWCSHQSGGREISLPNEIKVQFLVANHRSWVKGRFSELHFTSGGSPDQPSAILTTCAIRTQAAVHGLSSADFGSPQRRSGCSEFA